MILGFIQTNKKKELQFNLILYTKINPKWIIDPNRKYTALKLFKENVEYLCDLRLGQEFLDMTAKAQFIKEKIDNLDLIKTESFCSVKDC